MDTAVPTSQRGSARTSQSSCDVRPPALAWRVRTRFRCRGPHRPVRTSILPTAACSPPARGPTRQDLELANRRRGAAGPRPSSPMSTRSVSTSLAPGRRRPPVTRHGGAICALRPAVRPRRSRRPDRGRYTARRKPHDGSRATVAAEAARVITRRESNHSARPGCPHPGARATPSVHCRLEGCARQQSRACPSAQNLFRFACTLSLNRTSPV